MSNIRIEVEKLAKHASILIVDDSKVSLEMYRLMLSEMFMNIYTATNGKEAYDLWIEKDKNIDIILTDMMMPIMDGGELITKVRFESNSQKVMVLSGLENLNEMRNIINLGVDGIMLKPFKEEKVFPILRRVLSMVKAKKLIKQQYLQLKFLSKENVDLKINASKKKFDVKTVKKESKVKNDKYNIRQTFVKDDEKTQEFYDSLDYSNTDEADRLIHQLEDIEAALFNLHNIGDIGVIQEVVSSSIDILKSLATFMDMLGSFEVASNSAYHLIEYIENFDFNKLEDDASRKELCLDIYISVFEDTKKWVQTVFVDNDKENINYFDASFANSCLELEAVFSETIEEDNDGDLEFF